MDRLEKLKERNTDIKEKMDNKIKKFGYKRLTIDLNIKDVYSAKMFMLHKKIEDVIKEKGIEVACNYYYNTVVLLLKEMDTDIISCNL